MVKYYFIQNYLNLSDRSIFCKENQSKRLKLSKKGLKIELIWV